MRKNHHGKKDRLVKRVFALCLALAVICTCLVPVFATEGLIDPQVNQEASRPVDDGVASYPDDEFAGFGEEEATRPVDGGEAAGFGEDEVATRPVEGGEDNLDGGPSVTDSEWGTVIDYGTSTSTSTDTSSSTETQWSGEDDVVEKPDDKVVVSGDEIKKLQDMVIYRFWLKELNANDLQDITAQAQINNMTESEYLARNGEVLWNLYFIQAVPRAETIADYSSYIENPSSNRDPKGELRLFDYWYTLDEFGNRVRLNLTDPTSNILDDKTTTVNVYAAWKDGTVGSDEEEDVDHEDLVDKNPVPVDLETKAAASYEDEDGNTKRVNLPVEVKNLPSAAHSLSVIHMGYDDMQTFYESHSNDFGSMAPILGLKISPKNAKGETVQPVKGQKATVTVSGLNKLPAMEGATADTLKVLHQKDDNTVEKLDVVSYENGTLTFETSSFSPFVVVRTDGYAVNTLDINNITDVSIKDDIANSGHYVLQITADGEDYEGAEAGKLLKDNGFTVTWQKAGTVVDRIEKTNGVYSREENGGWVDVVYTDGANLTYTVTIAKGTQSLNDSLTVNYNDELKNGGFEDVHSNGTDQINADAASNLVWKTTAITDGQHKIEIGNTEGMTSFYELQANGDKWDNVQLSNTAKAYGCASANNGVQFAELNAEGAGALYQDVLTKPGQPMNWRFFHRARTRRGDEDQSKSVIQSGTDTMAMVIAPLELVKDVTTQAQLENLLAECTIRNGENYITKNNKKYTVYVYEAAATINDLSGTRQSWEKKWTGKSGWVDTYAKYSTSSWTESNGTYKIPDGQYLTRFFFAAISTASKVKTMGNLLDDVWFSQNVAPPTPGTGRVTVTKKFYGLTEAEAKTLGDSGFISYDKSVDHHGIADQALTAVDFSRGSWTSGCYDENGPYVSVSYVFDEVVEANTDYTYYFKEYVDKANVNGYDLTRTLVNGADGAHGSVTMNKENNKSITFSNFYKKNTTDVTITKQVTGLLGDTNKEFAFSVSITQNGTACTGVTAKKGDQPVSDLTNFTLKHNETVTLENVPIGATIKVTEVTPGEHYNVSATGHSDEQNGRDNVAFTYVAAANTATAGNADEAEADLMLLSMDEDTAVDADGDPVAYAAGTKVTNNAITVINRCDLMPDTGVLLDTLPYIVILAVVAGGVALLMLRKRRKEDD